LKETYAGETQELKASPFYTQTSWWNFTKGIPDFQKGLGQGDVTIGEGDAFTIFVKRR
jgi:hypothetical protein